MVSFVPHGRERFAIGNERGVFMDAGAIELGTNSSSSPCRIDFNVANAAGISTAMKRRRREIFCFEVRNMNSVIMNRTRANFCRVRGAAPS
jgi:hypothetical protein